MKKTQNTGQNHISGRSMWGMIMFRFRKNKLAMAGVFVLALIMLIILTAPLYVPYSSVVKQNFSQRFQMPSGAHWFGTDEFGRDLFARIIYGGSISLFGGLGVVAISFVVGCMMGGAAGFFGGRLDTVIMRIVDMFMAVPAALLAMAVITALGNGVGKLIMALAIAQFPRLARVVRASILTLRNQEFVEAARCYGTGSWSMIIKHILPNGMGPIIVAATLSLGQAILSISSMGFLGLGVASPTPEWGTILSENKIHIRYYPHLGVIPGVCIGLTVMVVNFIGDGLRDALDPRTKN